jgi:hypothetical protein
MRRQKVANADEENATTEIALFVLIGLAPFTTIPTFNSI